MEIKNSTYLVLSIILVILSAIGGFFLFQMKSNPTNNSKTAVNITPKIELIPTDVVTPTITASPTAKITKTPTASPTAKLTPTIKISPTATPSPTIKITPTTKPTITPTPVSSSSASKITTLSKPSDGFSIEYSTLRKLYEDTESSGNRYTFYLSSGNFAVHVGLNDKWAWTTPNRNFSGDFLIAGQNTYRYDISTQTIIDLQYGGKNYTLQCVHNGKDSLKTECETFLQSFKLL